MERDSSPEGLLQAAELYESLGKLGDSIRVREEALKRHIELRVHDNKSHINRSIPQKLFSTREKLQALRQSVRRSTSLQGTSRELFSEALRHLDAGDLATSLQCAVQAAQRDSTNADLWFNTGILFAALGQKETALTALNNAVAIVPGDAMAWYHLAVILQEMQKNDLADGAIEQALNLAPQSEEILIQALALRQVHGGRYLETSALRHKLIEAAESRALKHPLGETGVRFIGDSLYALGHLCHNVDLIVKMRELGYFPGQTFVCLIPEWQVANPALLNCWSKVIPVISDPEVCEQYRALAKGLAIPDWLAKVPNGRAKWVFPALSQVQYLWEKAGREPLLKLDEEDTRRGRETLERELGLPQDAWFVALYGRDPGFKAEGNSLYNHHRNSKIENFLPAVDEITRAGGWVVRMGDPNMGRLPPRERLIEYSHSSLKSDFLDVVLWAGARFYLAGFGGAFYAPQLFGVPCCHVDWPLTVPPIYSQKNLFIPKLIRQTNTGKILPLQTLLSEPFLYLENGEGLVRGGIEMVDNSGEDIALVAKEMLARTDISGSDKPHYSTDDEILQSRFSTYIERALPGLRTSRVGRDFLRRYGDVVLGEN